jgi:hypothetical protein
MDLKELDRVNPESHWYYQSKLVAIHRLIQKSRLTPTSLVDVGAGSGFFGKSIQKNLGTPELLCVDTNYETEWTEPGIQFKKSSSCISGDMYLFIDVLEHVKDDYALVDGYLENAPPGSFFIVTVPAFMSLWSGHDEYLEHFKRYKVGELEQLVEKLGAKTISRGYLFASIFPMAWVVRKILSGKSRDSSMKEIPRPINAVLRFVISLEHKLLQNKLFGLSAYILFKKP